MEYDRVIANLYISPILFEWTTFIQYFFHNAAVGAADLSLAKVTPFWHWCSIWSCNAFGRLDLAAWRVVQFTVRCWNLELCELAFGIVRLFICKMLLLRSRFLSPILFWILGLFGRIISFINCDWWENVGNSDVFFFPWAGRTTLHKVWHFHYKLHTWYLLISLDQRKSCALKWSKIAPTLRFNILGKSNANIVCADSMERRCEVLPWALWQIMVAPSDRCFSLNRHVWALQTEALSCFFFRLVFFALCCAITFTRKKRRLKMQTLTGSPIIFVSVCKWETRSEAVAWRTTIQKAWTSRDVAQPWVETE